MPKIDIDQLQPIDGSSYPPPFDEPCRGRRRWRLGEAVGLTQLGANLVCLAPGAWASQRHWHAKEDEIAWVVEGELVLVEDGGETVLRAGDCAGWPAAVKDGHHLQNRSTRDAVFLVVGNRNDEDHGEYSDIDLAYGPGRYGKGTASVFRRRDGRPY